MKTALIEMKAVGRRHDSGVLALEGVDLRVARGETVAVLGLASSGKSSLLRLMAGIDRPLSGDLLRDGEPMRHQQTDVSFVFSSASLMPWATAAVNVELPLRLQGSAAPVETREQRARAALARVGLEAQADALPKALNDSQRMTAALARALVSDPALLLLDDWLCQVPEAARAGLRQTLADARAQGHSPAVVLATRSIDEALLQAQRVLVLGGKPGRIVETLNLDAQVPRDSAWLASAAGLKARRRLADALQGSEAVA